MTADSALAVGDIELRIVPDGWELYPPGVVFSGVPETELAAALAGELDGSGRLGLPTTGLLVRSGGRLVLLDAGYGEIGRDDGYGQLTDNLQALGIAPADIDVVVISHGHADHIAGLTRLRNGRQVPVFTRATHVFWGDEWRFWTSAERLAGLPAELADPARACLPPLADAGLVRLVEGQQDVIDGIRIVPLPGHTPGHIAVAIQDGGQSALYVGDALFHPLNVDRPEWPCVYDNDPAAAVASRRRLLERASRDGAIVIASHMPVSGRVRPIEGGFRFVRI